MRWRRILIRVQNTITFLQGLYLAVQVPYLNFHTLNILLLGIKLIIQGGYLHLQMRDEFL